jgi:hypothetical protein
MTMPIDVKAVRSGLTNDGYIVVRNAVPTTLCQAVLEAIGHELDIWIDKPSSWERPRGPQAVPQAERTAARRKPTQTGLSPSSQGDPPSARSLCQLHGRAR